MCGCVLIEHTLTEVDPTLTQPHYTHNTTTQHTALVLRDGGAATTVLARLQQQRPTTAAAAATAPYRRLRSLVLAGDMTTTATTTTTDDRDPGPGPGPYPLTSDLLTRLAGPPLARLDLEGLKVPTPEALAALLDLLQLLGPGVDAAVAQQEAVGDDGDGRLVAFGLPGPGAAGAVPMDPQSLGKVLRCVDSLGLAWMGGSMDDCWSTNLLIPCITRIPHTYTGRP